MSISTTSFHRPFDGLDNTMQAQVYNLLKKFQQQNTLLLLLLLVLLLLLLLLLLLHSPGHI